MKWIFFTGLLFAALAAQAQTASSLHVSLCVIDEATGFRLTPDSVQVQASNPPQKQQTLYPLVDKASDLELQLSAEQFMITVFRTGYASMSTLVQPRDDGGKITFHLEAERESANYAALEPGAMLVSGNLSDAGSLRPIAHVHLVTADGSASTTTDREGYFQLWIPLPSSGANWSGRTEIKATCSGYGSLTLGDYDLYPYGNLHIKATLRSGGAPARLALITGRDPMRTAASTDPAPSFQIPQRTVAVNCATTIKVGKTCSCHTCSSGFDVLNFDTYTANVLTNEWGQWGAWTNGMQSLQAGAVAIRSYALNRINFPLSQHGSYNICNNTCCHVYNTAITPSSFASNAIANTAGAVLLTSGGNVASSEFAAETNDNCTPVQTSNNYCGQCGDGKFQKSVIGPPIIGGACYPTSGTDPLCVGKTNQGHPRGMCQRGSARWATGFTVPNNSTIGTPHGFPLKTWQQLLAYYYPYYTLSTCTGGSSGAPGPFTLTVTPECIGISSQNRLNWTAAANASSYDVYRNGGSSPYSSAITGTQFLNTIVTPASIYTYTVKAVNSSGSTSNSNGTQTGSAPICTTTAVSLLQENPFNIRVFPNPAGPLLHVMATIASGATITIRLTNTIGQEMYYQLYKRAAAGFYSTIPLSAMPAGIYLLRVQIGQQVFVEKVVHE